MPRKWLVAGPSSCHVLPAVAALSGRRYLFNDATALLMCLQLEPRPEQQWQLRETLLMLSSYFKML